MRTEVFLTRTAAYLPFAPVANEEIEDILGQIGGKPSRARRLVLRSNGITSRHYAIDRATGEPAMSNAQLTARAIRLLGDLGKVDCLASPIGLSATPVRHDIPAPALGEHTHDVLRGMLGLQDDEIEQLPAKGIIQ